MLKVILQDIKASAIDRLDRKSMRMLRGKDLTPGVDGEAVLR